MGRREQTEAMEAGHGSLYPITPVEAARLGLKDNPIWLYNRPGHWDRSRALVLYGTESLLAGVAAVGMIGIDPKSISSDELLVLIPIIAVVQCYLTYGLIYGLDFLKGRAWALEELGLTSLAASDIAHGSFASGVAGSFVGLVPLLAGEIGLWRQQDVYAVCFAILFLVPFHWLLNCFAAGAALTERTRLCPIDLPFLILLPLKSILRALIWMIPVYVGYGVLASCLSLVFPESLFGGKQFVEFPAALLTLSLFGWLGAVWLGRVFLSGDWEEATKNLYDRLET